MPPCEHHDPLTADIGEIKADVKSIKEKMSSGATTFATLDLRLKHVERVVYTAVTIALLAVLGVVLQPIKSAGAVSELQSSLTRIEKLLEKKP